MLRKFAEESGQPQLQLAKLERIQQYADAKVCRRKILLNYFGETIEKDCGNCDVCHNPPKHFDGTVVSQKALSAIYRTEEKVGITMLIDILRGSRKAELLEKGYDKIKTYGIGADLHYLDWQYYIHQLLNLGMLEIAYDQHNTLKLTSLAQDVLFKGRKVDMVRPPVFGAAPTSESGIAPREKRKSKTEELREQLFEVLRQLRRRLADEKGVPPYLVFTDATLQEMAEDRPVTLGQMAKISGVGQNKLEQYGDLFVNEILQFVQETGIGGTRITGSSHLVTLHGLEAGKTVEQIAEERSISTQTVLGHIAKLFEEGHSVDIFKYITKSQLDRVLTAIEAVGSIETMKPLNDYTQQELGYGLISIGVAFYKKYKKITPQV
jgi:ATP-dependent DNA helicase RecQ